MPDLRTARYADVRLQEDGLLVVLHERAEDVEPTARVERERPVAAFPQAAHEVVDITPFARSSWHAVAHGFLARDELAVVEVAVVMEAEVHADVPACEQDVAVQVRVARVCEDRAEVDRRVELPGARLANEGQVLEAEETVR